MILDEIKIFYTAIQAITLYQHSDHNSPQNRRKYFPPTSEANIKEIQRKCKNQTHTTKNPCQHNELMY